MLVWGAGGSKEYYHSYAPTKSVVYELVSIFKVVPSFFNL